MSVGTILRPVSVGTDPCVPVSVGTEHRCLCQSAQLNVTAPNVTAAMDLDGHESGQPTNIDLEIKNIKVSTDTEDDEKMPNSIVDEVGRHK